jgi:hypothetical protein
MIGCVRFVFQSEEMLNGLADGITVGDDIRL